MPYRNSFIPIIVIGLLCNSCSEEQTDVAETTMKAQPVTILALEDRDFSRTSNRTGSVSLYREEKIGFEVSGRVLEVLDEGKEVEGPAFDEQGRAVRSGKLIAKLDDTRYRLQVDATQARLEAAERDLESVRAELRLAGQTLHRQLQIFSEGAGFQQAVDDAQSRYDSLLANLAKRLARIDEIEEELQRAMEDFADCELIAPFSGRITRLHVSQGAVVEAGTPVVTLSLMDPIQVQVAVSADEDRKIQTGDRAILYPKDPLNTDGTPAPVNAIVYEKGAVADPDTRTFRIDLIARNERRSIDQLDPKTRGLPVVKDFLPVVTHFGGEEGELFIPTDSIYREHGTTYVLRLPGVGFHADAQRSAVGKHVSDKVRITLGDDYITVIKWHFRSLKASGDLREGDFLVVDPRMEHLTGLAIGRSQWLLRPGDLIPVHFLLDTIPKGLYAPVDAITMIADQHVVYVVEKNKARLKIITVHETYHELRRISGESLGPGTQIIVGGVHYISDGQPITIVGHEKLAP